MGRSRISFSKFFTHMCRSKISFSKFFTHMCRSKVAMAKGRAKCQPSRTPSATQPPARSSTTNAPRPNMSSISEPSTNNASIPPNYTSTSYYDSSASIPFMSPNSLSNLFPSRPESANIYYFSEISLATDNFLAQTYSASSSTASWRCKLRRKDTFIFQCKLPISMVFWELSAMWLSLICESNHYSVIKLLGASISDEHLYLVYEFISGVNLADCLRNPKNPSNTVLSTWVSRMQVVTDIANGLDYIHNFTGQNIRLVHKHITSSSILIMEPSFNAKICHLGRAQLCGVTDENMLLKTSPTGEYNGLTAEMPLERMYMAPEFQSTGIATQKSDVYAFGLLVFELLSGEDPLKCDEESGDFRGTLMIETARKVIEGDDGGGGGERWEREGRLRMWVDRRLNDSFPVLVAERLTRVALECVHEDPDKRPDMQHVAGMISPLHLESRKWWHGVKRKTYM